MFSTFLVVAAVASTALSKTTYKLDTSYEGATFFDGFNFLDDDPATGYADYEPRDEALAMGMITNNTNGPIYIGVDNTTTLPKSNTSGRQAVRIESKTLYNYGLFIADFTHVPGGICGVWPAYWMEGPNWPEGGELDIAEGVNTGTYNKFTGYVEKSGCTNEGAPGTFTQVSSNCSDLDNTGCKSESTDSRSWGAGFNSNGGGVYATEWASATGIKVWFWPRGEIPSDVSSSDPDPSSWGTPGASIPAADCVMDEYFYDMKIVINTNFCGAATEHDWEDSGCSKKASTCKAFVQSYPEAFTNAYWGINYIRAYSAEGGNDTEGASTSLENSSTNSSTISSTSAASRHNAPGVLRWIGTLLRKFRG